jgi:hypothetical protein
VFFALPVVHRLVVAFIAENTLDVEHWFIVSLDDGLVVDEAIHNVI